MKTDSKSIFLYVVFGLLLVSLILNLKGCGRESFDDLQKKIDAKQKSVDSLLLTNDFLKKDAIKLESAISKRDRELMELRVKIDSVSRIVDSESRRADRLQAELDRTDEQIRKLRKNPIKRDDQQLIDSFKNRFNRKP